VAQAEAGLRARRNPFSEQDILAAQAQVDQAIAQLELAQLNARETLVMAPVDGIVSERQVSAGATVGPQSSIVTIVPPSLELLVQVEEAQLGQVSEGQIVRLSVPAYPNQLFSGQVRSIAPVLDPRSRTASVRIVPTEDHGGKLKAGMFARLNIVTANQSNAMLVPREAVLNLQPGSQGTVVVVAEGNRAQRLPVRVGLVNDQFAEILAGISEGQMVALNRLNELSDGDLLAPRIETRTAQAQTP
jgi:RND family efflux transporter MFP subunit